MFIMKLQKQIGSLFLFIFFILYLCISLPINALAYTEGYDGMGPQKISGGQRDFKWPVSGNYNLTSCFYDHRNHCALDIGAPNGTSVIASYDGSVVRINTDGNGGGFGNYIVLKHNYRKGDGSSIVLYSRYNHLSSVLVSQGQSVTKGQQIGRVGNSGQAYGYHLDFQILYGGWEPYKTYSIDPYSNYLLELPPNIAIYDEYSCGSSYYTLIKNHYSHNPAPHTCNKGTYVYFWKAHPHPSCYKCSICGEVWADHSTTNYYEYCDTCKGTLTIDGASMPSAFNVGHGMTIRGTISSGSNISNVTVGCYDHMGKMLTGKSVTPNSTRFDINRIDSDVRFSSLSPGVYTYRVNATNSSGSRNLIEKRFVVFSDKATVKDGVYSILSNSKVCAVSAISNNPRTNIELAKTDQNSTLQQFKITHVGNGYYTIQNISSNMLLDVYNSSSSPSTNIHQCANNGTSAQRWQILPVGDTYCFVAECSPTNAMDVQNADVSVSGKNIWNHTINLSIAQKFYLQAVTTAPETPIINIKFDTQGGFLGEAYKSCPINDFNVDRGGCQLIVYDKAGTKANTNPYGHEIAVKSSGEVSSLRDYGVSSTLTVPNDGFILSGQGTSSTSAAARFIIGIEPGQYVAFDKKTMTAYAYKTQDAYLAHHKTAAGSTPYGPLPTPVKEGYTFDGWYTSASGGTKVAAHIDVPFSSDHTLYAHWTKEQSPGLSVHFPKVASYTQGQFTDVPDSQWFTNSVAGAVEYGLMKGNSPTTFAPYGDVTIAEAITMAARIHSIHYTGSDSFDQSLGNEWYQVYLDYAYQHGIIDRSYYTCNVEERATRAQYAEIFSNALPAEALYAQNPIADNAIPDVKMSAPYAEDVYKLYRAGILSGGDVQGLFSPLTYITRAESATIVARMANSDNRVSFTLS